MIVKCFQLMSYFTTSGGARFLRKWHKMLTNNPQKKASKVHQVINFLVPPKNSTFGQISLPIKLYYARFS